MTAALRRLPAARPVADVDEGHLGAVARAYCSAIGTASPHVEAVDTSDETKKALEEAQELVLRALQIIGERRAVVARGRSERR